MRVEVSREVISARDYQHKDVLVASYDRLNAHRVDIEP